MPASPFARRTRWAGLDLPGYVLVPCVRALSNTPAVELKLVPPDVTALEDGHQSSFFPQRACAAFLAIIFRFLGDRDAARAWPPFDAPNFDNAAAARRISSAGSC